MLRGGRSASASFGRIFTGTARVAREPLRLTYAALPNESFALQTVSHSGRSRAGATSFGGLVMMAMITAKRPRPVATMKAAL